MSSHFKPVETDLNIVYVRDTVVRLDCFPEAECDWSRGCSLRCALVVAACVCLHATLAFAQVAAGEITGLVKDQAGAAVPGATITVTETRTNLQRISVSTGDGVYTAASLAPGDYRVDVELAGFKPLRREGIRLSTGEKARIDFDLSVGDIREQVTVVGDAPIVRAETASLGTVVENEQVRQLPLNGRLFIMLAGIAPGVALPPNSVLPADQRWEASHERVSLRRYLRAAAGAWAGGVLPGGRRHPGIQD